MSANQQSLLRFSSQLPSSYACSSLRLFLKNKEKLAHAAANAVEHRVLHCAFCWKPNFWTLQQLRPSNSTQNCVYTRKMHVRPDHHCASRLLNWINIKNIFFSRLRIDIRYVFLQICRYATRIEIPNSDCARLWSWRIHTHTHTHKHTHTRIYIIISIQPWRPGLAGTRAQSCDRYGSGTLHPGHVLGGSLPLLSPAFRLPTLAARCLRPQRRERS